MEIGGRDWLAGCSVYDQMVLAVADEQGTCVRSEGWGAGLGAGLEATGAAAYAKRGTDPESLFRLLVKCFVMRNGWRPVQV